MRLIDSVTVPDGTTFQDTTVGGLSGIDYDPATGHYVVISDDKGDGGPTRVYTLDMPLDASGALSPPEILSMVPLAGPDGMPYPYGSSDTESVRWTPEGGFVYGSEGMGPGERPPFVRESAADGTFLDDFPLPEAFLPAAGAGGQARGLRPNLGFEGLALSDDGKTISALAENALVQDGPAAAADTPSPSRLLQIDRATGDTTGEYVYDTDPLYTSGTVLGPSLAGVSAMVAVDDDTFLTVERSFALPRGFVVGIYATTTDGADDVSGTQALDGTEKAMPKRKVFDFAGAGAADNIEGISWGPTLQNGHRSLILVSDNNLGQLGSTTFYLLDVGPGAGF